MIVIVTSLLYNVKNHRLILVLVRCQLFRYNLFNTTRSFTLGQVLPVFIFIVRSVTINDRLSSRMFHHVVWYVSTESSS